MVIFLFVEIEKSFSSWVDIKAYDLSTRLDLVVSSANATPFTTCSKVYDGYDVLFSRC
jgi:hypothetical protein